MIPLTPMTMNNIPKDSDEIDYTSPTFNWNQFDEGEITIHEENTLLLNKQLNSI